jgi:aspartate kinase
MSDPVLSNLLFERARGVHALQVTHDVAHAVIALPLSPQRAEQILDLFRVLAKAQIPVFLSKLHSHSVTLAVAASNTSRAEEALCSIGLTATITPGLSIVSVRASSMRDLSGVMVEIADALYRVGARFYETGDSHNSVQCLIDTSRAGDVVRALCGTFDIDCSSVGEQHTEAA